jgi:hypothetical protein
MKATKAYIASLGTTGVLLAAAILMLAVVSAVVAFDRWPGATAASPIQTLTLTEQPAPIRIGTHSNAPSATAPGRAAAGAAALRALPGGPAVAGERFSGGGRGTGAPGAPGTPAAPGIPQLPKTPITVPSTDTILGPISNPGTTASQLADGAQSAANAAGVGVGRVSPELGNAVSGTGSTTAQTIRQLPLPGHVIPGH